MPSGAKKRRNAKRKKEQEQQANSNNSASFNGIIFQVSGTDELKRHDERESDNSEVNSLVSDGHLNGQCQFDEGNEESKRIEAEESQKMEVEDGIVITLEKELNSVEETPNKIVNVEHEPLLEDAVLIADNEKRPKESNGSRTVDTSDAVDSSKAAIAEPEASNVVEESTQVEHLQEDESEVLPALSSIGDEGVSQDVLPRRNSDEKVFLSTEKTECTK